MRKTVQEVMHSVSNKFAVEKWKYMCIPILYITSVHKKIY